jgi:sporulation protein YhbH
MTRAIDRDNQRFKEIVRGKVRGNLKKYITHGEVLGKQGREVVSIPVPNIEIPRFRHGQKGSGGIGQGDGDVGQPIGRGQDDGDGHGEAGDAPGQHIREAELTIDELAQMLGEELKLPKIEPKGQNTIKSIKTKYDSIRQTGPDSLRHFKRTYKRALRRLMSSNLYDPKQPIVIPTREDERFRAWNENPEPQANAAIVYIMDVSGSMTDEQKEIVRTEAFWIDTWLKSQYDGVQRRYVVHDAVAHEVDEDTFYRTRESGGTRISSAYVKSRAIIERDFPPSDWNIYVFQFSDGDNWGEDNTQCLKALQEFFLTTCNLVCYGQVESPYGSGDYLRELRKIAGNWENLVLSEIKDKDGIYDSIRTFLGKGK